MIINPFSKLIFLKLLFLRIGVAFYFREERLGEKNQGMEITDHRLSIIEFDEREFQWYLTLRTG